jgi:hypothetical protein
MVLLLGAVSVAGCCGKPQSRQDASFNPSGWVEYRHPRQRFRFYVPAELQVQFEKQNGREWAVTNMMPFDYVNFRPQRSGPARESLFELGIGVHWNRDRAGFREFAGKKDDGLRSAGARIENIRQTEVTVAGIAGVRDDFRLRQPYGWRCYSRIVFPFEDTFVVLLCTTGGDRPIAGYERVFQKIAEGFSLPQESLDRNGNPL